MRMVLLFLGLVFVGCATSKKILINEDNEFQTNMLTDSERAFLIQTLHNSLIKFEESTKSLTNEQLYFKVKLNHWSIAECIEHVTLAEIHFSEIIEQEMKKPANPAMRKKIKIKDEKIRPKMLSRIWRAKTPEIFKPSGKFSNSNEALEAFKRQRLMTLDYLRTTNDDLRNHFWKHRFTGTIDLYQTVLLMSAHLERHTEQIEKIKKDDYYPL